MDPRFFLPCFHGLRASRLGHKRKEKNSVHNLPYGPRTRLIRGMYQLTIGCIFGFFFHSHKPTGSINTLLWSQESNVHNTTGDVALVNTSRETNYFHDFVQYPK